MPEELIQRHLEQFNDSQSRYRYEAHMALIGREKLRPILGGRFTMGKPLDLNLSFQVYIGGEFSERIGDIKIPEESGYQWREAYNQAVGLQGLEVADVTGELRSQEDTGGAFSGNRV